MPQIFKIGNYVVYFWANEGVPLEPIHVHISCGIPTGDATKVWITKAGKSILCNNASRIPERILNDLLSVIDARSFEIIQKWKNFFGAVKYYC